MVAALLTGAAATGIPLTAGSSADAAVSTTCGGRRPTIVGSGRTETIRGTSRDDVILAGRGNDLIWGLGGRDIICGGRGNDRIYGGAGADRLYGNKGSDQLFGGDSDDALNGGPGNDRFAGGQGNDRLVKDNADGIWYRLLFNRPSDRDRIAKEFHHRNLALGYRSGHNFGATWHGDHNMHCDPPDTYRIIHASRNKEQMFSCKQHLMTSMGDIDGYSLIAFSPKRKFTNARRVCWDVNLTDLGLRKWTEVHLIPLSQWRKSSMAYVNPERQNTDETALGFPTGSINFSFFNHQIRAWVGRSQRLSGSGWSAGHDKATRYKHCLTDNRRGRINVYQDRAGRAYHGSFSGSFPHRFRLVFTDHNYTPTKDGMPIGFTWHWDTVTVD